MSATELRLFGVPGLPEIRPGDDLAALLAEALVAGEGLQSGDVVVVTQKIVSKAEGRLVRLETVAPSEFARRYAAEHGKDPRQVEVVLQESRRVVRMDHGVLIAETAHGFVCANAGVDASNAGTGMVTLLPLDPDASARGLREALLRRAKADVAVIISDTFGRPWRAGQTNVAIGAAGIASLRSFHGVEDPYGYRLQATSIAIIDEIAAAAEIVMGKIERLPVVVVRGYSYPRPRVDGADEGAKVLVRAAERDMFR